MEENNNPKEESELLKLLEKSEKTYPKNTDNDIVSSYDETKKQSSYKDKKEKIKDFLIGAGPGSFIFFCLIAINGIYSKIINFYLYLYKVPLYLIIFLSTILLIIYISKKITNRVYIIVGFMSGLFVLPIIIFFSIVLIAFSLVFLFTGHFYL